MAPLLLIASSPSPLRGWVVPPLHRRRPESCAAPQHRFVPLAAARLGGAPTASSPARVMTFFTLSDSHQGPPLQGIVCGVVAGRDGDGVCVALARPDGVGHGPDD
jgi:hypothetical protein